MLRIEGLSVAYGPVTALDGVSLDVGKGECVALLGANGAGKTTLLRTISGLVRSKAGSVQFDGKAIDRVSPEDRVRAGLVHVPERRRIFPGLTVLENLMVATAPWRSFNGSIQAELDQVFDLFPASEGAPPAVRLVAVGRRAADAGDRPGHHVAPAVILLDEPSLGLAPLLAEEVYLRLGQISQSGVTMLLVEQNTAMALSVASRGYVLEHGHVVLAGKSEELLSNPRVKEAYLGA